MVGERCEITPNLSSAKGGDNVYPCQNSDEKGIVSVEWVNAHGAEQPVYGAATLQLRLAFLGEKPGETLIQVGGARTKAE